VDYFFRLRQAGAVVSIVDAIHYHPDVSRRRLTPPKLYYYVKNQIILNRKYFNAVSLRNVLTIAAALGRTADRNGPSEAFSYPFGRNARVFYRAILRGLQGKIGKDFVG
jgi:hypothetical protein